MLPVRLNLRTVPLARDPLLVAVAPDHPLAKAPFFPTSALSSEPYIRLESGASSEMDGVFRANGVEPHVRFSIVSDYAAMSLASAGLGFSVLSSLILENAPFPLAALPPEVPVDREIALCLRPGEEASAAARAFVEGAQAWVGEERAKGAPPSR